MPRTNGHPRKDGAAFAWPGRTRSEELERAAAEVAQRGLERLRSRQQSLAGPIPASPVPQIPAKPRAPDEPVAKSEATSFEQLASIPSIEAKAKPASRGDDPSRSPDPWESKFDDLADTLIDQLRRDLGPAAP